MKHKTKPDTWTIVLAALFVYTTAQCVTAWWMIPLVAFSGCAFALRAYCVGFAEGEKS